MLGYPDYRCVIVLKGKKGVRGAVVFSDSLYCSGADRDRLSAEAQARRFIVNQLLMMRAELDASSQKEGTRVHTRIMFPLWTHFLLLLFGSARQQTFFL